MSGEGRMAKDLTFLKAASSEDLVVVTGQHTTVGAADVVAVPGLTNVQGVVVTAQSDPVAGAQHFTAVPGGTAGSITIKGWKAAASGDTTLVAATTFGRVVNYIAWGT